MKGKTLLVSFYLFICTGDAESAKLSGKFGYQINRLESNFNCAKKNNNKIKKATDISGMNTSSQLKPESL